MNDDLAERLESFRRECEIRGKGPLSVALHVTRYAREHSLPIAPASLITEGGGQVQGLGMASVQAVLSDYGILRTLAKEGGRTSRGSIGLMRQYVGFLNDLNKDGIAHLEEIEAWWVQRVQEHFASKPLRIRLDPSKSLPSLIEGLLAEARKREEASSGTRYLGAVLQHLVGAKLQLALPHLEIEHHGAYVADASTDRTGDFVFGEAAIHVTSFPQPRLFEVCQQNVNGGLTPIIVTLQERMAMTKGLAEGVGLEDRIEMYDVVQFLSLNLREWSGFGSEKRPSIERLVSTYNEIVDQTETDPGLKIKVG